MIKGLFFARRKPGLSPREFQQYWRTTHADITRALTHIRLDMPDVIKEIEANHFHLLAEKEHVPDSQYMLILRKN